MPAHPQPLWDGREPLAGKTLLLQAEQGLGDTLQFCRYASVAQQQGARVVLEAQPPLVPLLRSLQGASQVVARGDPLPAFDVHCPLMSLPVAFGTTLDSVPSAVPYLEAPAERVQAWRSRLGPAKAPRVGLAWSGSRTHRQDRERSLALERLLAALPPGLTYVSLQKEVRDTDRPAMQGLQDMGAELADFADTAALCEQLDLVISVDSSVAHLAGALGRETWLLLPFNADWRWLLRRADSPWYPGMRLLRQPVAGDWDAVLDGLRPAMANRFPNARIS